MTTHRKASSWLLTGLVLLAASLFILNTHSHPSGAPPGFQATVSSLSDDGEIAIVAAQVAPLVDRHSEYSVDAQYRHVDTALFSPVTRTKTDHPWPDVIDVEATVTQVEPVPRFKPLNEHTLAEIAAFIVQSFITNTESEVFGSPLTFA